MTYDSEGQRFSRFSPEIPYELSAGAFFDEQSQGGEKWRYQKSLVIWSAKPFNEVAGQLKEDLEFGAITVMKWDLTFLKKEGVRVQLE